MAEIGYVLSHEQFLPAQLIELPLRTENAGFDRLWTSDHFHPWMDNQGHAGFAWITMAALGQRTTRIPFGTGVTCPTYRYRPEIVAQAFATLGILYPGRVFLGVGTGEALNERPVGAEWGNYEERAGRLVEAIELIRRLWTGEWVDYNGRYYKSEQARLYDIPAEPVPIYVAAGGPKSLKLAGRYGDGLITVGKGRLEEKQRQAFEQGAHEAGRDPKTLPILVEHYVVVGGEAESNTL